MKKSYLSKKKHKFINHTKNRLIERYNVVFTNQDLKDMAIMIKTGKSKIIKSFSNTRTLHKILYKEIEIIVVYNKHYKTIATAFEKERL